MLNNDVLRVKYVFVYAAAQPKRVKQLRLHLSLYESLFLLQKQTTKTYSKLNNKKAKHAKPSKYYSPRYKNRTCLFNRTLISEMCYACIGIIHESVFNVCIQ